MFLSAEARDGRRVADTPLALACAVTMQALEMDMARASSDGGRGLHGGVSIARIRHNPKVATAVIGFSFFSDYLLLLMMVPILVSRCGEAAGFTVVM